MSSRGKKKPKKATNHEDCRAEPAARIFNALDGTANALKVPACMKACGYSADEAKNRTLQQQVRRAADRLKGAATASTQPPAAAAAPPPPPACKFKHVPRSFCFVFFGIIRAEQ